MLGHPPHTSAARAYHVNHLEEDVKVSAYVQVVVAHQLHEVEGVVLKADVCHHHKLSARGVDSCASIPEMSVSSTRWMSECRDKWSR